LPYIGNTPAEKYAAFDVQYFTTSATASYTLDHAVANELDIRLVINNVIQEPGSGKAYTATGTTLTLSAATAGTDTMYAVYTGKASQTVNPPAGSVGINQLSATGTKDATTFLRGDNSFAVVSGTTINTNADNRVITGSGTANTLNGETNFIYNGTIVGAGTDGANADLGNGLHVKIADSGASVNANRSAIVVEGTGDNGMTIASNNAGQGGLWFANQSQSDAGQIDYNHPDDTMRFYTGGTERFRINGDDTIISRNGNYTNNGTGGGSGIKLSDVGGTRGEIGIEKTGTGAAGMIYFYNGNGTVGGIVTDGSSTSYNTSSDYRLKENEVAISDGITRLKTLKPYRFNFKADNDADGKPTKTVDGFFAHEVTAVPEAIQGEKDGAEMQSIDQAKLVPLLTSALQEAITKIETLEARVQTLENA